MRPDSSDQSALPSPSGDSALRRSFNRLYDENIERIETMALLKLSNTHDAQNAAAEVFVAAWSRMSSGNPVDVSWLYATLRNVVGNEYRRRERAKQLDARATAELVSSFASAPSDDVRSLITALAKLEVADREIIWLAFFEQRPGTEIAQILACSSAAARKRIERARARLMRVLAAEEAAEREGVAP